MLSYRYQGAWVMVVVTCAFLVTILWMGTLMAAEDTEVSRPPEIVLDAPPAKKPDPSLQITEPKAVTVYESKIFPGFRPCTSQDYHDHDYSPVACQDNDAARVLSTRDEETAASDLVGGEAISQGNIYKLRFERFFKGKKR